ncbi:MAG: hypothetical protein KH897_08630 [Bacteroides sp.]|uniref:hypothetical protein n=1 Tax=Bacteroides sp. TaxID=29523 RepID=UPI0025BC9554|nr:hypothetical protein [Bacteroides sp.]MBS6238421.1 hypothetical protein [Bacteroides sp.]
MKKLQYLLLCTLLLLMTACEKDTEPSNFAPGLSTGAVSDIYRVGATLSGGVQKSEGTLIKDCGILYSELQSMAEYTEVKVDIGEASSFSVPLQGLSPGKTYYYCAYASSGYSIAKGEVKSFATTESNAPVFGDLQVGAKNEKSFTVSATIIDEGGSDLILRGFCWKPADGNSPTVEDNVSNVALDAAAFTSKINDLTPGKEYVVCAYAINAKGVGYGKSVTVTTNTSTVPVVSSIIPTDSTDTSVQVEARILSRGETALTEKGFCWSSESEVPTTANLKKVVEGESDTYNANIDELKPATAYYIRAYAVNGQGTGYGDVFVFRTPASVIPELTGTVMTEVTATTAKAASSVIVNNGYEVTERGFCLSKEKMQPDVNDIKIKVNGVENAFAIVFTQLEPETTYYVRSYAANIKGIGYGEANLFTTLKEINAPTVGVTTVSSIGETSASASAEITSTGNLAITEKGFYYSSTNAVPTSDDTKVVSVASGTTITSSLSGLTANTKYYIRAYAINSKGETLGSVATFATKSDGIPKKDDIESPE